MIKHVLLFCIPNSLSQSNVSLNKKKKLSMVTFNCKLSVDTCHNLRTYTVAQKLQLHVLQLTNY